MEPRGSDGGLVSRASCSKVPYIESFVYLLKGIAVTSVCWISSDVWGGCNLQGEATPSIAQPKFRS